MTNPLAPLALDLLQAAFQAHPDAAPAWQRWRASVDWDGPIDPVAFSMLPRICRNLEAIGIDDPLFPRCKGIARQAWVHHQHLKAAIRDWVIAIPSVEFMVLPPTSLLFADSTAPSSQGRWLHFAVRPEQAAVAIRSLLQCGWKTSGLRLPNSLIKGYSLGAGHIPFERADGDTLTLTWRLENWFGERADEVWNDSDLVALGDHRLRCLCRTDAMIFVLRQPVGGDPLRWVSNVLSLASPAVDWSRVFGSLAMRPLGHECSDLLPTLVRFLDGGRSPTSSWQWPVAPPDAAPTPHPARSALVRGRQDWGTYRDAWGGEYRLLPALVQLPGYLMGRWHLPSLGRLPRGFTRWL